MSDTEMNLLILFSALLLEMIWVEGRGIPHIVSGFGNLARFFEKRLYAKQKMRGGLLVLILVPSMFFVTFLILLALQPLPIVFYFISLFLTYQILAGSLLIKTGKQVFRFLEKGKMEQARKRLTWLVGRDTAELTEQEIRQATLESMAENLSDGMIAPMFYFLLAGLPGMMAYKMINTLDSRIGYKNEKFGKFGYVAAKLDDLANWVPARITAVLMAFSAPRSFRRTLKSIKTFGRAHLSPNAGYPESALAGILDCKFGGAHLYNGEWVEKEEIGTNSRKLTQSDVQIAARVNLISTWLFFCVSAGILMGWEIVK